MLTSWLTRHRRRPIVELECDEAYSLWAPTYVPEAHDRLMEMEEDAMLSLCPDPAGRVALDVACGSGRYLNLLLERGARLAVGIDLSAAMLATARGICPRLVLGHICMLPFAPSSFDLVVCGLALGHVPDLALALRQIAAVTRPHGTVLYSDMHPAGASAGWKRTFSTADGFTYSVRHHIHHREDHERACMAAGLSIEDICEPKIEPGHRWAGWPAALVVRARRALQVNRD